MWVTLRTIIRPAALTRMFVVVLNNRKLNCIAEGTKHLSFGVTDLKGKISVIMSVSSACLIRFHKDLLSLFSCGTDTAGLCPHPKVGGVTTELNLLGCRTIRQMQVKSRDT